MKTLEIYDIDETLFRTNAMIHVVKNGSKIKSLTNSEYNSYTLSADETFDFSEFNKSDKFHNESVPIDHMIDHVRTSIESQTDVYFVTARDDFDNKELFLETFKKQGIDTNKIRIERAGKIKDVSTGPVKKKLIIRNILKTKQYDSVLFFDDYWDNLKEFYSLRSEFPNVEFKGVLV
jgi:predicted secreted acid phosphatase